MTANDDMDGMAGMRRVLAQVFEGFIERGAPYPEWLELFSRYAQLAEFEQRVYVAVNAAEGGSPDGVGDSPAPTVDDQWGQYTPGRIVTDCDGDRYYVIGYMHDGHPLLNMLDGKAGTETPVYPVRMNPWTFARLRDEYPPISLTDEYVR